MRVHERMSHVSGLCAGPVRVLHVDDEASFAALTRTTLERLWDGLEVVVETDPTRVTERLESDHFDCVVSDYQMPGLDGLSLLRAIREQRPNLPFIIYTGRGSEEVAADAFAAGATDYVRKGRGAGPATVLANRIAAAVAVANVETDYRALFDAAGDGFLVHTTDDDRILAANASMCALVGYDRDELVGRSVGDISPGTPPYDSAHAAEHIRRTAVEGSQRFEWMVETRTGETVPVEVTLSRVGPESSPRVFAMVRDVSERVAGQRRLAAVFDNTFQFTGLLSPDGTVLEANRTGLEFSGVSREAVVGEKVWETPAIDTPEGRERLRDAVERAAAGEFVRYDAAVRSAEGPAVVDFSLTPVFDGDGVELLVAEGRDVTDLREARRQLAESEERFRRVVEGVHDAVFETDDLGVLTHANDAWATVVDGDADDALGTSAREFFTREGDETDTFEALAGGRIDRTRHVVRHPDGRRYLEVFARAIREDGTFVGTVGTLRDVTERYEYERELTTQNEQLRAAYERIDEGYYALDEGWRVTYWNDEMVSRTGLSAETVVGKVIWDVRPELVGTEYDIFFREAMAAQRSVSFEALLPGESVWEEVRVYPARRGLSVYSRDVTERKARERELARTTELLDQAQEMAAIGGWEYDVRTGETLVTEQTRQLLDLDDVTSLDGDSVTGLFHPDDRERLRAALERAREGSVPFDVELRTADGERWIRVICEPTSVAGETVLLRGTLQDVTVRHRYEAELRERERALEDERRFTDSLLNTLPDPFYALDDSGALWRWNETFAEQSGYDDATLRGMDALDLVGADYREDVAATMATVYGGSTETVEATMLTGDDTEILHELNGSPLYDADGSLLGLAGAARDISERKARQRELEQQNERLEQFASIVSHDLRNPLGVATGGLDLARESGAPEDFDRVATALDRMEELVADLLTLAREGRDLGETMTVDLAAVAERAWDGLETDTARLRLADSTRVRADPERLTQALGNLFRNAVEHAAMPDADPSVTVTLGVLSDSTGFFVEDDGPGVPPEVGDDVFEFGHTDSSEGTGLGLAIVRSIVTAHGWTVAVEAGADGGARFAVTF